MTPSTHPRAAALLRLDAVGIAREDDAAIDGFFAADFVLHGADGSTGDLAGLKAYFAALRDAFDGLRFERAALVGERDLLAARTIVSGRFHRRFTMSPVGAIDPTGEAVRWEVMSIMRFDADDRLAEEWLQTDNRTLLRLLGVRVD